MRRAQASSIDLVLSIIGVLLFLALVTALVLRLSSGSQASYDDPYLDALPFLDGSRLDNHALATASQTDVLGDRYDPATHTACAIVLDGTGRLAGSASLGCTDTSFCTGSIVAHYRKPVLVDMGTGDAADNRFGELDVVICRA